MSTMSDGLKDDSELWSGCPPFAEEDKGIGIGMDQIITRKGGRQMKAAEVKTRAPFDSLFPIQEKTQRAIEESMKTLGYDPSQPITLWKEEGVVLDGHTRLAAAKNARIEDVAVCELSFPDEKEALAYSIHNQRDRRNMTDAQIVSLVKAMDKTEARGGDRKSPKAKSKASSGAVDQKPRKSAERMAKAIGVSARKVERVRELERDADEETKQAVQDGTKSINKALKETQERKKKQADARSGKVAFKEADRSLGFAKWAWEPVTMRDQVIAWHEKQLDAPKNTAIVGDDQSARLVLLCPSLDFFSPRLDPYRERILKAVAASNHFRYVITVGKKQAHSDDKLPGNVWAGVRLSAETKLHEVTTALQVVPSKVKFLIWNPCDGDLVFPDLSTIDWIIFDAPAETNGTGVREDLWTRTEVGLRLAKEHGCSVYFTPRFWIRPIEYPTVKDGNVNPEEKEEETQIESPAAPEEREETSIAESMQPAGEGDRNSEVVIAESRIPNQDGLF